MLKQWTSQNNVHAVHRKDMRAALEQLGLLDRILNGEAVCTVCGSPVEINEIQCMFMEDGEIQVCCSKLECFEHVFSREKS